MLVALLLLVGLLAFYLRELHRNESFLTTGEVAICDDSLWLRVYRPQRLVVMNPCMVAEGTVVSVQPQDDGDLHILVNPDDTSILNDNNYRRQRGHLVVEPVCFVRTRHQSARRACRGFTQTYLPVPDPGDRVRIVGAYVLDKQHGWMEIHPVTTIERIP